MATPIIMPKQGNTVEECILVSWKIKVGDRIKKGDLIADIETDKATFELESPESGTILALFAQAGEVVPVLQNIGVIGSPGEKIDPFLPQTKIPFSNEKGPSAQTAPTPAPLDKGDSPNNAEPAKISPRAQHKANQFYLNIDSLKGSGPQGRIIERDIDRALGQQIPATPLAKRVMEETGKQPPLAGSGVGMRILSRDLLETGTPGIGIQDGEFSEIKLSGIRKIIANRMFESIQKTAQLTLTSTAGAGELLRLYQELKSKASDNPAFKITLGDLILFSALRVLQKFQDLNATLQNGTLRQYRSIHLGFACQTDRGLLVPVIAQAEKLTLIELSQTVKNLSEQARQGTIAPDLLQGGTFTVTNLGTLGITSFTPVLNYPQVAILGVNTTEVKPIRKNGGIIFEDQIGFSLTIDHQAIDGWKAALFLQELKQTIESISIWVRAES